MRVFAALVVLVVVPCLARAALLTPHPDLDAPCSMNFDFYPGAPHIDIYNWSNGPQVSLAPTGRDDAYRPMPGIMIDERATMEFDLSSLAGQAVQSAVLEVYVEAAMGPFVGDAPAVAVRGYVGNGVMDAQDYGSVTDPSITPVALEALALVNAVAGQVMSIDVTGFIQDRLSQGQQWAGFNLHLDPSCLPERSTLPDDTDFIIVTTSANSSEYQVPTLNVTVPEPALLSLLALAGLGLLRRRQP